MDLLAIIVNALVAGARQDAPQAVRGACAALKALLARKSAGAPNADDLAAAIRQVEKKPSDRARRAVLRDELKVAGLDKDAGVLELVAAVQASLKGDCAIAQGDHATAVGAGGVYVGGSATGSPILTGDHNTVTIATIIQLYQQGGGREKDRELLERQVAAYLKWTAEMCGRIDLRGIRRAGMPVSLDIDVAYVPLRARVPAPVKTAKRDPGAAERPGKKGKVNEPAPKPEEMERGAEREIEVDVEEALKLGSRLAIIGGPGSGKTTVLNHIAWALASSLLRGTDEAQRKLGLSDALPVPILLPLAAYAAYCRELKLRPGVPANEYTLRTFIAKYLTRRDAIYALPEDFFTALLNTGRDVMLLLDGLDEVADEDERARVSQAVEDLVRGKDNLRAVVTCRTVAYATGRTALVAFRVVTVQPLDPFDIERHIAPMVCNAYACIYPGDAALATGRSDDLLAGIGTLEGERRERLGKKSEPLTVSPLMVRMLLMVHYDNRRLPPDRAELYEKAVDTLIKSEHVPNVEVAQELRPVDPEVHLAMAQSLAHHLHGQGQAQGREIEDGAVRRFFAGQEAFAPHARALIAYARNRGGLLEGTNARYRFIHLGFQEFLAARYLKEVVGGDEGLDAILRAIGDSRVADSWWREPVLLLCGYTAAKSPESARELLRRLAEYGETAKAIFAAAELAGTAAAEWRNCPPAARQEIAARIAGLFGDRELCMAASPVLRARAGRALSVLGDLRPGVGLRADGVPDIDWVDIPDDGEFIYGEGETRCKMRLPAYRISRYPVTYAQFQAFVDAEDGFRNPRWWKGLAAGEQHRRAPREQRFPYANHPRERVSWYDAVAFCRWLSEKRGECISLPTEQQWERAARGRDGREYAYAGEFDPNKVNTRETGIGQTSAVGIFPSGASEEGVMDLTGNVWEWCLNEYGDSAKVQLGRSNARVLRGGAWLDGRVFARAAWRGRYFPLDRHSDCGVRLVLLEFP